MKRFITLFALVLIALSANIWGQRNSEYQPAIFYSSLLSSITIEDEGRLKFVTMWGAFFPSTQGTLKVMLDGNEIGKYKWTAVRKNTPFVQIQFFELISGNGDVRGLQLPKGGSYEIVFEINGKPFQRFRFNATKKNVGTKYKTKNIWQREGDWDDYAYLFKDKKGRGSWKFRYYTRGVDYKGDCYSQVFMSRDSDQVLIAKTGKINCNKPRRTWVRAGHIFKTPTERPESPGSNWKTDRFEANNYVFKDGSYTIKHEINGKVHATYKFVIKDNVIQPQGRQLRGQGNPLDFIEGGGTTYWLKKQ